MRLTLAFLLFSLPIFGAISLDDMMSREDMERTGIDELNYSQKKALEKWLNQNFTPNEDQAASRPSQEQLFLSMNIEGGSKLQLSDGSIYEIDPDDQIYTVYWITPLPLMLTPGSNPDYPMKITNMQTGIAINGKLISRKQFFEEVRQKQALELEQANPPPQQQTLPKQGAEAPPQPYQEPPRQQLPKEPIPK